jgi:hypothetical protein
MDWPNKLTMTQHCNLHRKAFILLGEAAECAGADPSQTDAGDLSCILLTLCSPSYSNVAWLCRCWLLEPIIHVAVDQVTTFCDANSVGVFF